MTAPTASDDLAAFSRGEMTAIELRKRLGGATYGEVMILLGERGLPLPRASTVGREAEIARARAWLFPSSASGEHCAEVDGR